MEVVRAGWWVAPLVLGASLGSVAYLTAGEDAPTFEASAVLAVVPVDTLPNENQVLRALELLEQRTTLITLSRMPAASTVLERAAARAGSSTMELGAYRAEGSVLPSTHMIRIAVRGPDPGEVERLARAVVSVVTEEASRTYPVFAFQARESVARPDAPLDASEGRTYAVASVLGLFFGVGAAYGVGVVRTT